LRSADNDLDRAVNLFYFVVRMIHLVDRNENPVALTPFDTLMLGHGDGRDRLWVFASVLRQMGIDAVRVSASKEGSGEGAIVDNAAALAAVLLNDEIYLMDFDLGLVVPSAADSGDFLPQNPATLREMLEDESPLTVPAAGEAAFPLTAEQLSKPVVEVVGTTVEWSARMNVLQSALIGDLACTVHEQLADLEDVDGLISRVRAAFGESASVSIWAWPQNQAYQVRQPTEEHTRARNQLFQPFDSPIAIQAVQRPDGRWTLHYGAAQRIQLGTRIDMIMGDYGTTVTSRLQSIRLQKRHKRLFPEARQPGVRLQPLVVAEDVYNTLAFASEDAMFWIAVCQYELEDYSESASTLLGYLAQYEDGRHSQAARYHFALTQAHLGNMNVAIAALETADADAPGFRSFTVLRSRWQAKMTAQTADDREGNGQLQEPPRTEQQTTGSEDAEKTRTETSEPEASEPETSEPEASRVTDSEPSEPDPTEAGAPADGDN